MYIKIGLLITADSHSKIKRIQFKCPILSIHLISVADYLPQCPAPSSRPALPTKFTSCWYRIPSPWQFPISGASVSLAFLSDSSLWSPRRARESTLPEGHFKECVARDHGHSTWCLCGCPAGLPSPQPHCLSSGLEACYGCTVHISEMNVDQGGAQDRGCTPNVRKAAPGTALVAEGLRLHASSPGSVSWIPGWGTKILHAARSGQKINKNKKWCKKFMMNNNKKI